MHSIEFLEFSATKSINAIQKACQKIADTNGDYKGQCDGIRFRDHVMKDRKEAESWIRENDAGWYDNLAVKYKDGRKTNWLVKIEYHC